jgi:hypothetical protein
MSEENRPNINAAGLAVDIMEALKKYTRGPAAKDMNKVYEVTQPLLIEFCDNVSDTLDDVFKVEKGFDVGAMNDTRFGGTLDETGE